MTDISSFPDRTNREKTGLEIGIAGIVINGLIFAFELFSGFVTGSTTITADAFHNSVDAFSAVMTVTAFAMTGKPADSTHPFGFGRIEYLTSFLTGMLITGIGLFFARSSILKLIHPAPAQFRRTAFILMLISILLKLLYSYLNHIYAEKVSSPTLEAAGRDALNDVLILTASAISLPAAQLTSFPVDGLLGLAISGFILFSGGSVLKKAAAALIGTAPDKNIADRITTTVLNSGQILGVHDLQVHDYGPDKTVASIHAEIPADMSLVSAHRVAERAETALKKTGIELTVHIDPVSVSRRHRYGRITFPFSPTSR